jgi:S-adenosylmethionine decarboxylase
MNHTPGLHVLAEIHSEASHLLTDYAPLRLFYAERIGVYGLQAVGEVFHHFEGGGFTGVICLTESHLAVHTWPELGMLTFDVYLSNFRRVNDGKARHLLEDTLSFFKATRYTSHELVR